MAQVMVVLSTAQAQNLSDDLQLDVPRLCVVRELEAKPLSQPSSARVCAE